MRRVRGLALLGVAGALAGCGATADQQVQAKLQQFAHAVAAHNAGMLCQQVLAPALVQRFSDAGLDCAQAMQTYFQSVSDPTLSIARLSVRGSRASADVVAGARGQSSTTGTVQLTQTRDGWRVSSLTTPP